MSSDVTGAPEHQSWAKGVKVVRSFSDFDDDIIGLDISRDGTLIVAYSNSMIAIYDVTGSLKRKIRSEEKITKLLLKPNDPGLAFYVVDNSSSDATSTVTTASAAKTSSDNRTATDSNTTSDSTSGDVKMKDSTTTSTATSTTVTKPPSTITTKIGTHLRCVDLFIDQVYFELRTDSSLDEFISFIALHPNADTFVFGSTFSCSIWDYSACLKSGQQNLGLIAQFQSTGDKSLPGPVCLGRASTYDKTGSCAAYDAQGLCFAMGVGNGQLQLFDSKTFIKGSFLSFPAGDSSATVTGTEETPVTTSTTDIILPSSVEFSPCGKYILYDNRYLLDAYDGDPIVTYPISCGSGPGIGYTPCTSQFSADSEMVMQVVGPENSSSDNSNGTTVTTTTTTNNNNGTVNPNHRNQVYLFSTTNASLERTLSGFSPDAKTLCAQWNPSRAMLVTGSGKNMQWWI